MDGFYHTWLHPLRFFTLYLFFGPTTVCKSFFNHFFETRVILLMPGQDLYSRSNTDAAHVFKVRRFTFHISGSANEVQCGWWNESVLETEWKSTELNCQLMQLKQLHQHQISGLKLFGFVPEIHPSRLVVNGKEMMLLVRHSEILLGLIDCDLLPNRWWVVVLICYEGNHNTAIFVHLYVFIHFM